MSAFPAGQPISKTGFFTPQWRFFLLDLYNKTGGPSGAVYASSITFLPYGGILAANVQDAIDDLEDRKATVVALASLSTSASTGISSLSTGLSTTNSNVSSLSTGLSTTNSNVGSLSTGLGTTNSSLVSLSTSTSTGLSTLTSSVGSLSTGLSTHTSQITSLSTGLSTTNSSVGSLSTGLSTHTSQIASLSTGLSTTNSNVTSLSTGLSTTNSNVGSLSTGLSTTNSSVGSLSTGLSTHTSQIGSLSTGLSTTNSGVVSLSTGLSAGLANKFLVQGTSGTAIPNAQFLGALVTGIAKVTATTGVISIAVAADFPTLNQNTTGTAAGLSATLAVGSGGTGVTAPTGTYTPTLTNVTNVAASTAYACQWMRIANMVVVSGIFDIDPTASGAATRLDISLPVASNLANTQNLGGTASSTGTVNESAAIVADAVNKRASVQYFAATLVNHTMAFSFMYQVL